MINSGHSEIVPGRTMVGDLQARRMPSTCRARSESGWGWRSLAQKSGGRWRVFSATSGGMLMTRDTVWWETPASAATSLMDPFCLTRAVPSVVWSDDRFC